MSFSHSFSLFSSNFRFSAAVALLVGMTSPLAAEEQAQTSLDAVVVTGTPLVTELQELPGSASVIGEAELLESGPSYFQNQILSMPNVNWAGGTSRPRFFQIRGVGDLEQYEGAPNSSVAVILDDVDVTGVGAALSLFDVSQLEVHRGPQPIRFGSSALAGAINATTGQPSELTSGLGLFSLGNDSLVSGGGAVGGAISEGFQFRLSAFGHRQDGFRNNEFLNDDSTNDRNEFTGRAKLRFQPSESASFTLSLINAELDNGYDAFTIFNGFTTQSDQPGEDSQKFRLASLRGEFDLSEQTQLVSITSYYDSGEDYSFDGDWGNNPFWAPFDPYDFFSDSDRDRETFAQQFRVVSNFPTAQGDISWLNGVFFQSLDEETEISQIFNGAVFDELSSDYQAYTTAAFTNVSVPISEEVSFSLGGRLEHRDTEYTDTRGADFSPDDLMVGGAASLEYEPYDDSNFYLLASRGFRGGGFNGSPNAPTDRQEYDDESLINLELGNRSVFLEGDLLTSVAAFVNFRRDQQIKLAVQDDPSDPLSFTFLTDNAGRGRSYGLEAEADYFATEQLSFRGTGGLLRTEITSIDPLLSDLEGRDQSHAPRWQYSLRGRYSFIDSLSMEVGVAGRANFYFDDSHDAQSDPYHLLNAALVYTYKDWEVQLWGRNLTDEAYAVRGFFFGNEPPDFPNKEYVQLGDPRAFGLTAIYRF